MDGISIVALQDTVIKRLTIDSSDIDSPGEKFNLSKGEKIAVNWYRSAPRNHWEFELKSNRGGFFNWYAFKDHVEVKNGSPLDGGISASRQLMAFLDMVAWAEGTDKNIGDGQKTGYNIIYSFQTFSDFSDHPRRIVCAGGYCSSAAGRYQFLNTTWDTVANALNIPDFYPVNQDKGAIQLIKWRGALTDIEQGRIRKACNRTSWEWASLPPGRYDQPIIGYEKAEDLFVQAGGILA
ncbi:MAG TPA: lysozyme [Cyanothece sp. UBA12306]|nr:lysozyme [Cyanothece sp. UBA12306]